MVGTSGIEALRAALVTPIARICRSRMKGRAEGMLSMPSSMRSATISVSIGAEPR